MGKANINLVMTMLDPERCAEVYELPNIMARESFRLQRDRADSFDQMMDIVVNYYIHHFTRAVAAIDDFPRDRARGEVWRILENRYEGGIQAAYKAATKGIGGGLAGVLDSIRDDFLKDQEEKYFLHTIMESVDVMDLEDVKDLMSQYIQRYGRYIDGQNLPTPEFLVPKYREVIRSHAQIVRSIRMRYGRV